MKTLMKFVYSIMAPMISARRCKRGSSSCSILAIFWTLAAVEMLNRTTPARLSTRSTVLLRKTNVLSRPATTRPKMAKMMYHHQRVRSMDVNRANSVITANRPTVETRA